MPAGGSPEDLERLATRMCLIVVIGVVLFLVGLGWLIAKAMG